LNDILDLAKIEAGKMALHPTDVVFEEVFERLMALFSQVAQQKGNQISYQIAKDVPRVLVADETRLLQILSNLTSNALKFTENGRVDIDVSSKSITQDQIELLVQVKDTGIGITQENVDKLFSAFQQLDNSTKKVYGGTGLGLAISREFCKMMQGEIGVESKIGEGSTFWFTLKLAIGDQSIAASSKKKMQFAIQGTLERLKPEILLVDDNSTNRKVASQILTKAGCLVDTAVSGQEAIEKLSVAHTYDLVMMDIQMPGMDGMETTQYLKKADLEYLPPIIAMTAYAMKEDKERFLTAGMDDYIAKPIRAKQLIDVVGKWISGKAAEEQMLVKKEVKIPVVDKEILDSLLEAVGGEQSFVIDMLTEFVSEAKEQINAAIEANKLGDCKGVQSELHTLKGNSGTLGAAELHNLCEIIEKKAKVCEFSLFENEIEELKEALGRFERSMM
jgi:CheY-like chemotaxis protein